MLSVGTQAQRKNSRYVDYIDKYKEIEDSIPGGIDLILRKNITKTIPSSQVAHPGP